MPGMGSSMPIYAILLFLVYSMVAASFCASLEVPMLAPDQIRPGMAGIGKTVFSGTKIDTFDVKVVDVMHNVLGPKQDLILARLSGGPLPLEKTLKTPPGRIMAPCPVAFVGMLPVYDQMLTAVSPIRMASSSVQ